MIQETFLPILYTASQTSAISRMIKLVPIWQIMAEPFTNGYENMDIHAL